MWGTGSVLGGRYRLTEHLGSGSMGDVWRAVDTTLERTVAVKILRPLSAEPAFAERFLREARILAALNHPGIVRVHDYGESDGGRTAFLVMELLDGVSLQEVIAQNGALDPARTLSIVAQTLDALAVAHARGVVHRDVKPANLMVNGDTVVVTDFGIALSGDASRLTEPSIVLGTALYGAPEQTRQAPVTAAADLYSIGAVAYECLSGSPPFADEDLLNIIVRRASEPVPPLPEGIPRAVRDLVLRALSRDPADRFADAAQMAAAARSAADSIAAGADGAVGGSAPAEVRPGRSSSATPASSATPDAPATVVDPDRVESEGRDTLPTATSSSGRDGDAAVTARHRRGRSVAILAGVPTILAIVAVAFLITRSGGSGREVEVAAASSSSPSAASSAKPAASASPASPAAASSASPAGVGSLTTADSTRPSAPPDSGNVISSVPAASTSDAVVSASPEGLNPTHSGSPPSPVVDGGGGPYTVTGQLSCLTGNAVVGVWVQADVGKGFANWQLVAGGKATQYWYQLPEPESFSLVVGCGGTQQDWQVSAKVDGISERIASFSCDDKAGTADYAECT
jgi:serine/threonine-protein kinase